MSDKIFIKQNEIDAMIYMLYSCKWALKTQKGLAYKNAFQMQKAIQRASLDLERLRNKGTDLQDIIYFEVVENEY